LESDKINVITFLTSFKKIIVCPGKFSGNVFRLDVVSVKKAAHTGML